MNIRVTPFLDKEQLQEVKTWERGGGKAFLRVIEQNEFCRCRNCGDRGFVIVSFCTKGPFKTPASMRSPSTYYGGGDKFGAGWYLIERTIQYKCANCKGKPESLPQRELIGEDFASDAAINSRSANVSRERAQQTEEEIKVVEEYGE